MRRRVPVFLVALGLLLLLGSYVWYAQRVVDELRSESERTGRMFARVYGALVDTSSADGTAMLLDLSREIRELGVPVIVTDADRRPTYFANLPELGAGFRRLLDQEVIQPRGVGVVIQAVHFCMMTTVPRN